MGNVLFISGAGESALTSEVYLSSTGNDANDGLSPATPVATWARAWTLGQGADKLIVHLSGSVDGYVAPDNDWVIITGDDSFTEIATGAAGAGTTATQLELAVAVAEDAYRHFTVEFTDGAAQGFRRTIRDNDATTLCTYVQAMDDDGGAVVPLPGDTYRILQPSAKIGVANTIGTDAYLSQYGKRVDVINAAFFTTVGTTLIHAPSTGVWFGVDVEAGPNLTTDSSVLYAGADNTMSYAIVDSLFDAIGHTRVSGAWNGWGLSFSATVFGSGTQGLAAVDNGAPAEYCMFTGYVTCAFVLTHGALFQGGSARNWQIFPGSEGSQVRISNLTDDFTTESIPYLLKNTGLVALILYDGSRLDVSYAFSNINVSIDIRIAGNVPQVLDIQEACALTSGSRFNIDLSGTGRIWNVDGDVNYVPDNFGAITPWSAPNASLGRVGATGTLTLRMASCTVNNGIINEGGIMVWDPSPVANVITASGYAFRQLAGTTMFLFGTTFLGNVAGGAAMDIQGGYVKQTTGVLSVTNSNAGADVDALRVNRGAGASFLGGANTLLNASAGASGYGANARRGGRIFFDAQPTGVVGTTADLTVGTAGGEDQPDTALAAADSGLLSTTGNVIARGA